MEIEKYIINLLHQKDCVVIPGLGGFVSEYNSADIHPVSHRFTPPSKKLAFNEMLQSDEGLLTDIISISHNITKKEAYDKIERYVGKVKSELTTNCFYEIKEVGRFIVSSTGKLEFEAYPNHNFLDHSFGLSDMIFKPIERNTMKTRPAKKASVIETPGDTEEKPVVKKKSSNLVFAIIPIVVLIGAGAFVYANKNNASMQAYFPFTLINHDNNSALAIDSSVPEGGITTETGSEGTESAISEAQPADLSEWGVANSSSETNFDQPAIKGSQGAYSIIVGSFSEKRNAEKLIRKISKNGGNALLIEPANSSENFRVSVAEYNEKQVALEELEKFRSVYGPDTWMKAN